MSTTATRWSSSRGPGGAPGSPTRSTRRRARAQGGCFETSRPTTHSEPTYVEEGVVHYCVANIPGAVARTSTLALTSVTLPYLIRIADEGVEGAVAKDPNLAKGLSTLDGELVHGPVAEAHDLPYTDPQRFLDRAAIG